MPLFDKIFINDEKIHMQSTRVFAGLRYLILYGCNAYPKFDHKIASVDAVVYERDKLKI